MTSAFPVNVAVNPEQCSANGSCRALAPTVFGADEHGWVVVREAHPAGALVDAVLEAADSCPMAVIDVRDERGISLV